MNVRHLMAVVALVGLWPAAAFGQASSNDPSPAPAGSHGSHEHSQATPAEAGATAPQGDHSAHQAPERAPLPPFIPPITDEDRRAAFPDVAGHAVHDNAINYFVLFDQLEWQGSGKGGLSWDNTGWVGQDRDRFWFRTEGEAADGRLEHGEAHLLYGRAIARWWDVVAGVRQDVRPGPAQTWAAVGIQGLAPYWFEIEGTAYVGAGGRTQFRLETEYEVLLTNRLILQPLVELQVYGKADPERGIGAGLSSADAGLRLRYVLRRELAPYVGVTWNRTFFGTRDLAKSAGDRTGGARLAVGIRLWL
jgi:copper resistance protein B